MQWGHRVAYRDSLFSVNLIQPVTVLYNLTLI